MKIRLYIIIGFAIVTFFSSDMFLPSIPQIAQYFYISESTAQFSIILFFVGQLALTLFWGALADKLGHQKVFNIGVYVFLFGTILCTLSTSISSFLIGRIIEGLGSGVAPVVGLAIIQSMYPNDKSTRIMSIVGGIIALAPMIAPSIGGQIERIGGWRGNFYCLLFMVTLIVICFKKLPEEKNKIKQKKMDKNVFQVYAQIISNKIFTSWIYIFAFLACGQWCFITIIPFFYKNELGLTAPTIGALMTFSSMFFITGTFSVNKILRYISVDMLIRLGTKISILGSIGLLLLHLFNCYSSILISLSFGIYLLGASLLWGSTSSKALQCFKESLGSASAVRSLLLISFFALGSYLGTFISSKNLLFISILLIICSITSVFIHYRIEKITILNDIEEASTNLDVDACS